MQTELYFVYGAAAMGVLALGLDWLSSGLIKRDERRELLARAYNHSWRSH